MCVLITAIHYSNKSGLTPSLDTNFGTGKFAKDKPCILIMLADNQRLYEPGGCSSGDRGAGLHPRLVDAPPGIEDLGSIPGWSSELLLLNTKAGHVTVTYQQWQEFSSLGFLRPCFSETSLFYN